MFLGEYQHTIDTKGRLAVPAKFRGQLTDGAVVTRGLDGCLALYSAKDWEVMASKIANLPMTDANVRSFQRFMLSGAMVVSIDSQGRVLLPAYLRQYAKLSTDVVVTGVANRIEIWDGVIWKTLRQAVEDNASDVADRLTDLGI